MRWRVGRWAGLFLSIVAAGCGGDSSTAPSTTPVVTPTPAPVSTVLLQGSQSEMDPLVLFIVGTFVTTAPGRLDVSVDWTFASNDIDVYVSRGTCTIDQVNQGTCPYATFSESPTAKPEKMTVNNLEPGSYTLMIGNLGPTAESASYQVVFTR